VREVEAPEYGYGGTHPEGVAAVVVFVGAPTVSLILPTSHHIISHHITSHHITSHHITSHHITSHHITSHHITSHYKVRGRGPTHFLSPLDTPTHDRICLSGGQAVESPLTGRGSGIREGLHQRQRGQSAVGGAAVSLRTCQRPA
jgi:hypothetical protein